MKGAMVGFGACEDQVTAATQVFANRRRGHGMWRADIVRAAGTIAAVELNWDTERLNKEISAVDTIYEIP